MRYKNLLISSVIGLIGMILYFVTIPTIDQDQMVQLTVEAGDEALLDDLIIGGYLYTYSSFLYTKDGVSIYEETPYLEKLDLADDIHTATLQATYPDFANDFIFDYSTYTEGLLTSDDYLISAQFKLGHQYSPNLDKLNVKILDKNTNTVKEEVISRSNFPTGSVVEFMGMYQEYPKLKFLLNTYSWENSADGFTSHLSILEYNVETKVVSEEIIHEFVGAYYPYDYSWVYKNQRLNLLSVEENNYVTEGQTLMHLFNFENNSFEPIDGPMVDNLFVSDEGVLYSYDITNDEMTLTQHDENTFEAVKETTIVTSEDSATISQDDYFVSVPMVSDNKFYFAKSEFLDYDDLGSQTIKPSHLFIFDIETGEELLYAKVNYDLENYRFSNEASIESIGLLSNYK